MNIIRSSDPGACQVWIRRDQGASLSWSLEFFECSYKVLSPVLHLELQATQEAFEKAGMKVMRILEAKGVAGFERQDCLGTGHFGALATGDLAGAHGSCDRLQLAQRQTETTYDLCPFFLS